MSLAVTEKYWTLYASNVIAWSFLGEILKWLGGAWIIIEPISYFSKEFEEFIKPFGIWILITAICISIIRVRPKIRFKYPIAGKDVSITIQIGDLFNSKSNNIIIPTNAHFITEVNSVLIDKSSVQGQFTEKYYSNSNHLDKDIEDSLKEEVAEELTVPFHGKNKKYKLGTTARIEATHKRRLFKNKKITAYFFSLATLNEKGVCQSNITEYQETLPSLWTYLQSSGPMADYIMPILGSGHCRINATRQDLYEEILQSFLIAIQNKKFCKSLTIVLYYKDVSQMNIDIDAICNYTEFYTKNFGRISQTNNIVGSAVND